MRIDEGCNYYALAYYYYHIGKIYDTTRLVLRSKEASQNIMWNMGDKKQQGKNYLNFWKAYNFLNLFLRV